MATSAQLEDLYAHLRANLLARHFALGRYFRANYFTTWNDLGVRPPEKRREYCCSEHWQPAAAYSPSPFGEKLLKKENGLLEIIRKNDSASATMKAKLGLEQFKVERWRVMNHERENPLMMTGF